LCLEGKEVRVLRPGHSTALTSLRQASPLSHVTGGHASSKAISKSSSFSLLWEEYFSFHLLWREILLSHVWRNRDWIT